MKAEFDFWMPETTTLAEQQRFLKKLNIDGRYDVGGEDGLIDFYVGGQIQVHEAEDEDMPQFLRIVNEEGYRIGVLDVYNSEESYEAPDWDECLEKLKEFNNDYQRLWNWMKRCGRGSPVPPTPEEIRQALVILESFREKLGAELVPLIRTEKFDPDNYYTPIGLAIQQLILALGFDPRKIRQEAHARGKDDA